MAETQRDNIRGVTLDGLDTAARKDKHGGRPAVITDDRLHTVLRRRAAGETVEAIRPDLIIPTGKRKGQTPSLARGSVLTLVGHGLNNDAIAASLRRSLLASWPRRLIDRQPGEQMQR